MALSALSRYDTERVSTKVTQSSHGFVVGDVIRFNTGTALWVDAQADSVANLGQAVVVKVYDTNSFEAGFEGKFTFASAHGLTLNTDYYLSAATAALLTSTPPTIRQKILRPITATDVLVEIQNQYSFSVPPGGSTSQVLTKNSGTDFDYSWGTVSAASDVPITLTQSGHGFSSGSWIRHNGSSWVTAQGNTIANSTGVWFVKSVSGNDFTIVQRGRVTGLSGYTAGQLLYLSAATAGAATNTKPVGTTSTPLGIFLPVAYVESSSVIHVLGQGYPEINPVLAEYINTDSLNNYSSVTFSNLDVASYGGALEFEISMGGLSTGGSSVTSRVNSLSQTSYQSFINYDNGSAWTRQAFSSASEAYCAYTSNGNTDQDVTIKGTWQLSRALSYSGKASLKSEFFCPNYGTGVCGAYYYGASVSNITSVLFTGNNFAFRQNGANYARIFWKGPRT